MANEVQYVSDESGGTTAVIVPIALWREIESERLSLRSLEFDEIQQDEIRILASIRG